MFSDSQDDTSAFASFTQVKYNTFAELMKYSMVPEPLDEVGEITNTSTYVITKDKTTLVLPVDNVQGEKNKKPSFYILSFSVRFAIRLFVTSLKLYYFIIRVKSC